MDECLQRLNVGVEAEGDKVKMAQIEKEYEESIKHKSQVQPYGIKEVDKMCPYPVEIGKLKTLECTDEVEGQYTSYTPKHVDTPEEVVAKYYASVLRDQKKICDGAHPIECIESPPRNVLDTDSCEEHKDKEKPIIVSKPEMPLQECKVKRVMFVDDRERCNKDRFDLCHLKQDKTHCDCTEYQKEC